jgi:hypothetical protein
MSSLNTISFYKLARLVGTANCPVVMGIRTEKANPQAIPSSTRRSHLDASDRA